MIVESGNTVSLISKAVANSVYNVEKPTKADETFSGKLRESEISSVKKDIYDKFGVDVGKFNDSFECHIPTEVLCKMNKDSTLKRKVYDMLADYTSAKFQMTRRALDPPVKKCTLVFDKKGDVVATLAPNLDNEAGNTQKSSERKGVLQLLENNELSMLVSKDPQHVFSDLEIQNLMLSLGLIEKRKK